MKNKKMTVDQLMEKGFIILPKALIYALAELGLDCDNRFAYLVEIINHLNFSDTTVRIRKVEFECHRGESLMTFRQWGSVLNCNERAASTTIHRLTELGLLEFILHKPNVTHIVCPFYDCFQGKVLRSLQKQKSNELFSLFWENYHKQTYQKKTDIGKARKEWAKLSLEQQRRAIDRIDDYYYSLANVHYVKHAATYLEHLTFENDF